MKLISYSGSSMKIAGHLAIAQRLNGNDYDVYAGVSGGAIVATLQAFNKLESLSQVLFDELFSQRSFFDCKIISFKSIWRFITMQQGMTKMVPLFNLLLNTISDEEWKQNSKHILIGVTKLNTGKLNVINISTLTKEEGLEMVVASCTIPFYSKPVNGYVDGGLNSHNLEADIMIEEEGIKEVTSIYSYSDDLEDGIYYEIGSWFKNLGTTIKIMSRAVSDDDDNLATLVAKELNIKRKEYRFKGVVGSYFNASKYYNELQYLQGVRDYEKATNQ